MSDKEEQDGDEDGKKQKASDKKPRKTAKQMASSTFRKAKKLCRKKRSPADPPPGKGCYLCFMRPITSDTAAKSQPDDPNSPEFTYEFLKSLIEKNDFYSKECNPHIQFDS